MAQKRNYATKKKGKTEVYPFWNLEDIKNVVEWFENNNEWDGYLITLFGFLFGRRIGDTISMKWSDLYFENGNKREEIVTIEEQKTGKTTEIPIGNMVFEVVEKYCKNKNVKPIEHYNDFIFEFGSKTEWINRKNNPVYKTNDLELWCKELGKDLSQSRKDKIIEGFNKQSDYDYLGDYLYYEVEWMDVVKWQANSYRNLFNKATEASGIEYKVSTHSLRKTFGYWIHQLHPFDPDCLISLSKLFNHSSVQQTMDYIGLTTEKNRKYVNNHNDLIRDVLNGNTSGIVKNSPIISIKSEDFGNIIMEVIKRKELNDVEKYQLAINMANELRV